MAPDDAGDDSHRPPPHPLDRIWIHPSELGSTTGTRSRRSHRGGVVIALVAGLAIGVGVLTFATFLGSPGSEEVAHSSVGSGLTDEALTAAVVLVTATQHTGIASGSGVSLGGGQIVTSAQLVADADDITVTGPDGFEHVARVAGRDDAHDLALLEVYAALPSAPLGRSDLLAEDARVVAVAATAEEGHWMRFSRLRERDALAESLAGDALFAGLLTTDLPTTPSQAGGALVNPDGLVVGVLVAPPGTGLTGAAVPIEKVTGVCDQIRRRGHAAHGWIGIVAKDTFPGVRVHAVLDDAPAHEAGIQIGDIVTGIGNREIEDSGQLVAAIRAHRPGDVIELRIARKYQDTTVTVTVGALEPESRATS